MLSSALYWLAWAMLGTLVAFAAGPVVVWAGGLVEWEGEGRKVTIGSPKSLAIVGSTVMALAFGANANFMAIIASAGGSAPPPSPPTSYAAPAAPTIDVVVDDTTTWRMTFSEFAGDGDDTQDSISVTILRAGTTDTLFHAVSGVQSVDTIVANDSLKADSLYYGLGRQKGVNGGWSPADSVDVTNTVLTADGSCIAYNGVSPFFEFNPNDYADSADFVNNTSLAGGGPNNHTILDGQTLYDGSTGKVYRFTHPGGGIAVYANRYVSITGASADATDTVWAEAWYRATENPGSSSDNKSWGFGTDDSRLWPHLNPAGPNAWIDIPASGINPLLFGPTTDNIFGQGYSRDDILYGGDGADEGMGTWHRIRMYVADESASGGDGAMVLQIDTVMLTFNEESAPGDSVSGLGINYNAGFSHLQTLYPLGANQGWQSLTNLDAGANCLYLEDPGWDLTNGGDADELYGYE